jgi:hypothetical protein
MSLGTHLAILAGAFSILLLAAKAEAQTITPVAPAVQHHPDSLRVACFAARPESCTQYARIVQAGCPGFDPSATPEQNSRAVTCQRTAMCFSNLSLAAQMISESCKDSFAPECGDARRRFTSMRKSSDDCSKLIRVF